MTTLTKLKDTEINVPVNEYLNQVDFKEKIKNALGTSEQIDADKYIRGVLTTLEFTKNEKLKLCTPRSIILSVLTSAQLGLPVDSQGLAYLIPYFNGKTKKYECQLMPGYKGYIKKIRESSTVDDFYTKIVYDGDSFDVEEGTHPRIIHKPSLYDKKYGDDAYLTHVYSVIVYVSGRTDHEIMTREQINKIRDNVTEKNKGKETPMWKQSYGEMARKTDIRRHQKRIQLKSVQKLVQFDNHISNGNAVSITDGNMEVTEIVEDDKAAENELTDYVKEKKIKTKKVRDYCWGLFGVRYPKLTDLDNKEKILLLESLKRDYDRE